MTASRMNIQLLMLLAAFFIAVPMAFARPGGHEVREAVRDAQRYQKNDSQSERYDRFYESRPSENPPASDFSKRSGRMSPEERRALRQQINEAGQDLYYRSR